MMKLKKQYIRIIISNKKNITNSKYINIKNNNNPPRKKLLIFNIVVQEIKN